MNQMIIIHSEVYLGTMDELRGQYGQWCVPLNGTRCWNKSSPIFFPKVAQKVVTSVFTRKVLFFKKLFGDTFVRKFVAKSFKNSPIWSHCSTSSR